MSIFRNSLYNLTALLLPTAVTLFTVPVYLRLIGVDREPLNHVEKLVKY